MEDAKRAANIAQEHGLDIGPTTCEILRTTCKMRNRPFVPQWVVSRLRVSPSAAVGGAPLTAKTQLPQLLREGKVNSCVE